MELIWAECIAPITAADQQHSSPSLFNINAMQECSFVPAASGIHLADVTPTPPTSLRNSCDSLVFELLHTLLKGLLDIDLLLLINDDRTKLCVQLRGAGSGGKHFH